jgi:hypothetical protein
MDGETLRLREQNMTYVPGLDGPEVTRRPNKSEEYPFEMEMVKIVQHQDLDLHRLIGPNTAADKEHGKRMEAEKIRIEPLQVSSLIARKRYLTSMTSLGRSSD